MADQTDILPSIPCSRNLRRRTGVWLGVEAWELFGIALLSLIPDVAFRMGFVEKPSLLLSLTLSGGALGFVVLFKRNKPPNYFSIWLYHHFLHPEHWRAPQTKERTHPILEDQLSGKINHVTSRKAAIHPTP
jgi:hypothetical protein